MRFKFDYQYLYDVLCLCIIADEQKYFGNFTHFRYMYYQNQENVEYKVGFAIFKCFIKLSYNVDYCHPFYF